MKRLFLALATPFGEPKIVFKKLRVHLDQKNVEHRWVAAEGLHVTLHFLGETDPALLPTLLETVAPVVSRHASFPLGLSGLEAFPETRMGRVVWIGVRHPRPLRALQEDVAGALVAAGFPAAERDYVPHLTVARLRNPRDLRDALSPFHGKEFGEVSAERVTLFESVSAGSYPLYRPLHHWELRSDDV